MNDGIRIGVIYVRSPDKAERRLRKAAARSLADLFLEQGYPAGIKELPAYSGQTGAAGSPEADVLVAAGVHSRRELRRMAAYAEVFGIAAAGLDPAGATLNADRVLLRRLLAGERIPQCLFRTFTRTQWERDTAYFLIEMEMTLGYPCRIGPADACCGSGVVLAANREELQRAVEEVFSRTDRVLAEETVKGRGYAAALGGGGEAGDIAVMELEPAFAGVSDGSGGTSPGIRSSPEGLEAVTLSALPPPEKGLKPSAGSLLETEVRNAARRAFAALQGKGPGLLFFVTPDGQNNVLLTDADLCPSLGPDSIHAAVWRNAGRTDGERLQQVVRLAAKQVHKPGKPLEG